jgi:hypothetical protein
MWLSGMKINLEYIDIPPLLFRQEENNSKRHDAYFLLYLSQIVSG